MKKKLLIAFVTAFVSFSTIYAQDSLVFKPSGSIIARGFFDYSVGLGDVNEETGFDITRAFLGYNYQFTPTLKGQIIIDGAAGKTSTDGLEVYLRNAFINWNDKGFNVNVGQIGLLQYSIQEKYWMHRYVMKSFQDLNSMAPSVDLGITGEYRFNSFLSVDLSVTNGEGYKKVKKNNSTRYAAGLSIHPIKNTLLRVYGDIYNESEKMRDALPDGTISNFRNQYTLSVFAGYQDKIVSGGIEYNRVYNKGFVDNKDYYGYSIYTSARIASQLRAFARYDWMDSYTPNQFSAPWNKQDGQVTIVGVEFQPLKQLKVAPNFRNINKDRAKSEQYLFVNLEFNL